MPIDVEAPVIHNRRLSPEYNVLGLAAPEIAAAAQPGQFVMVKTGHGRDPLLRRPFSVFEILRDASGTPTGLTLLNKQIGVSTSRLFDAAPGQRIACLGPLGKPFAPIEAPGQAWMVAGGVGLAPFALLAEDLHARGTAMTLFYGARKADELFYLEFFTQLGVRLVLTTEDGSRGERGRVTGPLERELATVPGVDARHGVRLRPRRDAGRRRAGGGAGRPAITGLRRAGDGLRHGRLLQLRSPGPRRRRQAALCPVVPRRPGVRRRRDRLGVGEETTN